MTPCASSPLVCYQCDAMCQESYFFTNMTPCVSSPLVCYQCDAMCQESYFFTNTTPCASSPVVFLPMPLTRYRTGINKSRIDLLMPVCPFSASVNLCNTDVTSCVVEGGGPNGSAETVSPRTNKLFQTSRSSHKLPGRTRVT